MQKIAVALMAGAFILLSTLTVGASYDKVYDTIAVDDFTDYGTLSSNKTLLLKDYTFSKSPEEYGFGFNTVWSKSLSEYVQWTSGEEGFRKVGTHSTLRFGHSIPIYRCLNSPVDFSKTEGVYEFSITIADMLAERTTGYNLNAHAKNVDFRYMLGSSDFSFGYKYDITTDENGVKTYRMYPKLSVGSNVIEAKEYAIPNNYVYGDDSTLDFYNYTLVVALRNGKDSISLYRNLENEARSAEPVITMEEELSGRTCKYVGISATSSGTTTNRINEISVEKVDPLLSSEIEGLLTKSELGEASEAEVERAFELLSSYRESNRSDKIDFMRRYAVDNSMSTALNAKIKNASIQRNARTHCSLNRIEVEFNYKIEDGDLLLRSDGNDVPCTVTRIDERTYLIETNALEPDKEYEICGNNMVDYKGDIVDDVLLFSTLCVPNVTVKNNKKYSENYSIVWDNPEGITTQAVLVHGGIETPIENNFRLSNEGNYELRMQSSSGGVTDTYQISFTVEKDVFPTVKDVRIESKDNAPITTGTVLVGKYTFCDENEEDREATSRYSWYRGDERIENADTTEYELTSEDENCYIYFEVTPVSDSYTNNEGAPIKSPAFAGAFAPVAQEVSIGNKVKADEYLTVTYKFFDVNGDAELPPVYRWYMQDRQTNEITEITDKAENGEDGTEKERLMVDEYIYGKNVYATVTPKSDNAPSVGKETPSNVILGPVKPVVSNVRISGNAVEGNTLTGYYNWTDENLDNEGESVLEWIDADSGAIISKGATLDLQSSLVGKRIAFRVLGKSINKPFDSDVATSKSVTVAAKSNGRGGGSSSFRYGVGFTKPTVDGGTDLPKQDSTFKQESTFYDIKTHWAKDYIDKLYKEKIIRGRDEDIFAPDDKISRCEFLAMLMRTSGVETASYNGTFSDVNGEAWYAGYIQPAIDKKVISLSDSFRPNDFISREEMAKMIANFCELQSKGVPQFEDNDIMSEWAVEYINAACESKLIFGDDQNCFRPKDFLTRAEAATVIYRIKYERAVGND